MRRELRPALVLLGLLTLLTGVIYPVFVTAVAAVAFPRQAAGSLVERDGQVIGSALVGQAFPGAGWFHPRPSATPGAAYNAASSAGSNLGPTNPVLDSAIEARARALRQENPGWRQGLPVDLLTSSGSGLDPDISVAAARFQVRRVAAARRLPDSLVAQLVERTVTPPQFGLLGERRVNVLRLNLALDALVTSLALKM
jgi:K+-transporting ATPase ATPase C chain